MKQTKAAYILETGALTEQTAVCLFMEVGYMHYTQWTGKLALGKEMTTKVS